jgi:hypothetical protein
MLKSGSNGKKEEREYRESSCTTTLAYTVVTLPLAHLRAHVLPNILWLTVGVETL